MAGADEPGPCHVESKNPKKLPTVVLVIGMAGSGKTRYMHRMNIEMHEKQIPSFFINLDPAVLDVPYGVNIDIRDTVSHKEVMKQYNLGPNGAIITSLNLFATRFDQVLGYIEQKQEELEYVFIDTPGQIEVFTWSASGQIIMETLASTFPTVVCYVMDAARSASPATFMSNMMYSCGILYRTQLPLLVCMNKIDIADHREALRWMQDLEAFQDALSEEGTYSAQLTKSMANVMQEFYANLRSCGMSAVTGEGVQAMLAQLKEARQDYIELFLPELKQKMAKRREEEAERQREDIAKLSSDIDKTGGFKVVATSGQAWDGPDAPGEEGQTAGRSLHRGDDAASEDDDDRAYLDEFEMVNPSRAGFEDDPDADGAPPAHLLARADQPLEEEDEDESHREFMAMLAERAAAMKEGQEAAAAAEQQKGKQGESK
eukprot:TRINITY_DN28216_c0_g1_i1.p1 TRINITY_DN28216_c0_g1~~TRINITY_DN28216_c0_g1_i1.p1  ORF type:complete len:503 (+),score=208.12 TRINITY_DN28216_c0_g1_i1:219-1511(+)